MKMMMMMTMKWMTYVLEPLGEEEGHEVPQVHGLAARPPASVQEELLPLLHLAGGRRLVMFVVQLI